MTSPFIGEVRMFGGNFAPAGWALCDGRILPIAEYDVLYALLGTTYGGDGVQTFAVPDMRGRAPVHMGSGRSGTTYVQGQLAGSEGVTLLQSQMPSHNHLFLVNTAAATTPTATGNVAATPTSPLAFYDAVPGTPNVPMSNMAIQPAGNSLPHANMQPYLCATFIISLFGVFPSHN